MKLYFLADWTETEHTIDVLVTKWDESTPCITVIYDGVNDKRSPSLTADEARGLARRLTLAAEELEAQ